MNTKEALKKARSLAAELYTVLDEVIGDDEPTHERGERHCSICLKRGHRKDTCPDKPNPRKTKKLTELEFNDAHERFHDLASSRAVADELNLPIGEVNAALETKEYRIYISRARAAA